MFRTLTLSALLALASCGGLSLFDSPRPVNAPEQGPLTVPPHLRDGSVE